MREREGVMVKVSEGQLHEEKRKKREGRERGRERKMMKEREW